MKHDFYAAIRDRWRTGSYVCIGLDIDLKRLPESLDGNSATDKIYEFITRIVDATSDYACAYKLNSAHYEALGADGAVLLARSIRYSKERHPDIPVILDAKRGDIADTNEFYAAAVFDELGADAVTVHPYMGKQSLLPFLRRAEKGVIVMGANSAEGAGELQNLTLEGGEPLYRYICQRVATEWNEYENCAVTASALDPDQLAGVRSAVGDMPILLLGIGAQGGDLEASVRHGAARDDLGIIINISRAIMYASSDSDFAEAAGEKARQFNEQIAYAQKTVK